MKTTLKNSLRGAAVLLATSLAATLAAQAADPTAPAVTPSTGSSMESAPSHSPKAAHRDRAFFEKAAKSGKKEIAVSQAVTGRLTNPQVQAFAGTMVTDHTTANDELMRLAVSKGVAVPETDTAKLMEKWTEKDGNLDKKYIHEMVEDHEDAVKLFEKASKSDDAEIAAFAQRTLPTLQHHLQMARDLKKTLSM